MNQNAIISDLLDHDILVEVKELLEFESRKVAKEFLVDYLQHDYHCFIDGIIKFLLNSEHYYSIILIDDYCGEDSPNVISSPYYTREECIIHINDNYPYHAKDTDIRLGDIWIQESSNGYINVIYIKQEDWVN